MCCADRWFWAPHLWWRRVSVWRLPSAYEADGGAGGRPEGTSTLQVAERHTSVLPEDHSWCRVEVSRVLQMIMFIGGKYSGIEWVALDLIERRALSSYRWASLLCSLASADRVTYEHLTGMCATRIEKRGLYSLLRSGIERDDSNTRTDASIASYLSVAFDRYLVCYNRWDIDAAVARAGGGERLMTEKNSQRTPDD